MERWIVVRGILIKFFAFILSTYLFCGSVNACVIPPEFLYQTPEKMVSNASSILLSTFLGSDKEGNDTIFRFRVIEKIKGESADIFQLSFKRHIYENSLETEEFLKNNVDHNSYEFWVYSKGRTRFYGDCEIYPLFKKNNTYLIFNSSEISMRSYEEIGKADNLWLKIIKELASQNEKNKKYVTPIMDTKDFLSQFENINLYRCPDKKTGTRKVALINTIKGQAKYFARGIPNFKKEISCGGTGIEFVIMESEDRIPITAPVLDGYIDFTDIFPLQLISNNRVRLDRFNQPQKNQ